MPEDSLAASSQFRDRLFLVSDPDAQRNAACRAAIVHLGGRLIDACEALLSAEADRPVFEIAPYRECCVLSPDAPGVEQRTADWLALQMRTDAYVSPAVSPLFRPLGAPPAEAPTPAGTGEADPPPHAGAGVPAMFPVAIALVGFAQPADRGGGGAEGGSGSGGMDTGGAGLGTASSLEHDHALMMVMRLGALYAGSGCTISGDAPRPISGTTDPSILGDTSRAISGGAGSPISDDGVDWFGVTHLVCCHQDAAAVARARPWMKRALGIGSGEGEVGSWVGEVGSPSVEIVHLGWLEACVRGWARVPEERYRLGAQHLYHPSERGAAGEGREGGRGAVAGAVGGGTTGLGAGHSPCDFLDCSSDSSDDNVTAVHSATRPSASRPSARTPAPAGSSSHPSAAPSSSSHGARLPSGARARREAAWEQELRQTVRTAAPRPPVWMIPAFSGGGGAGNAGAGGSAGGSGGLMSGGMAFYKPMMPSQIAGG
jgi:hypothetical protein